MQEFTKNVIEKIKAIPEGYVATYGQIALMAGNPRAARQAVRILHSQSQKHNLPWHRIINSKGKISLPLGNGYEEQKERLELEGIKFNEKDKVDLNRYGW